MTWFMVDIEADGPCPGLFSMIQIGVVKIEDKDSSDLITFYGKLKPHNNAQWAEDSLKFLGISREEILLYPDPYETMSLLKKWIHENTTNDRPMFMSDNNGFDWQFVNYYFHYYCNSNPFGHSSTNLGSLYKGINRDFFSSFKHLRKTPHDHNPVNDAIGNVEALLYMKKIMGLKINL